MDEENLVLVCFDACYEREKRRILLDYVEAMMNNDYSLMQDLQGEYKSLNLQYDARIEEIKG